MLGQERRLCGVTGFPLTSVGVCLCLLTLTSVIETGEGITTQVVSDCGRSSVPSASNAFRLGQDVLPGQWPWQVHLKRNGTYNCGGILLNNQWVATATQCVGDSPASAFRVVLGSHLSTVVEFHEREIGVAEIVPYPGYGIFNNMPNNDISLLFLNDWVPFSNYIRPVCLPGRRQFFGFHRCYVTGWRHRGTGRNSSILQQARVNILPRRFCNLMRRPNRVLASRLCDFIPSRYSSACFDGNGAPLVCPNLAGRWEVYGLSSYGPGGCHSTRITGDSEYTNIYFYRSWIERTLGNMSK